MKIRAIEPEDIDLLLAMDEDTSSADYSIGVGPLSRHLLLQYAMSYNSKVESDGQLRYVAEDEGVVTGIVDLYHIEPLHRKCFIGIYLLPEFRGHGYGARILPLAEKEATSRFGILNAWALVFTDNESSERLFERCGYERIAMLPEWLRRGRDLCDAYLYRKSL